MFINKKEDYIIHYKHDGKNFDFEVFLERDHIEDSLVLVLKTSDKIMIIYTPFDDPEGEGANIEINELASHYLEGLRNFYIDYDEIYLNYLKFNWSDKIILDPILTDPNMVPLIKIGFCANFERDFSRSLTFYYNTAKIEHNLYVDTVNVSDNNIDGLTPLYLI